MNQILKDRLKALFLSELSIDEGWSAYLDLLLGAIDSGYLDLCSTSGFPFRVSLDAYKSGSGPITYSSDTNTFTLESSADYGTVYILVSSESFSKVTENGKVVFDGSVEKEVLELNSGNTYQFTVLKDGVFLEQAYLPESLNPKAIVSNLRSHYLQPLIYPTTSPQALYGAIAQLTGLTFQVVFKSRNGVGTPQRSYTDYVKCWNVEDSVDHLSFVTDVHVPLDALRDRFGYGDQQSHILGYDKCYCVVASNAPQAKIVGLVANYSDTGGDTISVQPNQVLFPQHSDPVPLATPQFTITSSWPDIRSLVVTVNLNPYPDPDVTFPDHNITYGMVEQAPETKTLVEQVTSPQWEQKVYTFDMSEVSVGSEPTRIAMEGQWLAADTTEANSQWVTTPAAVAQRPAPQRLPKPSGIQVSAVWNAQGTEFVISATNTPTASQEGRQIHWECLFNGTIKGGKVIEGGATYLYTYQVGKDVYEPVSLRCYYIAKDSLELDSNNASVRVTIPERPIVNLTTPMMNDQQVSWSEDGEVLTLTSKIFVDPRYKTNLVQVVLTAEDGTEVSNESYENPVLNGIQWSAQITQDFSTSYTVKARVLAKQDNERDSEWVTYVYEVPERPIMEITVSPEILDFPQREGTITTSVTVIGGYDVTTSEIPAASKLSARKLSTPSSENTSDPVVLSSTPVPSAYGDDFGPHPSKVKVRVRTTPAGPFTTDFSEADSSKTEQVWLYAKDGGQVKYLISPNSILPKNRFGFTKNYEMLTLLDAGLEEVQIIFNTPLSGVSDPETLEKALVTLLENSIPAGVKYVVDFVYPQVTSEARLYDAPRLVQEAIYVDGYSGEDVPVMSLGQRSQNISLDVQTRPNAFSFDVRKK